MSNLAPADWLSLVLGYNVAQNDGVAVPNSPGRRVLNFLNPASIVDNPSNGSTDITFPSSDTSPTHRVDVSTSGTSVAYTRELVDLSGGSAITRTLPSGAASGTRISYKIVAGPVNSTAKLVIAAPGGGTVEQLLEQAGVGMNMAATTTFELTGDLGSSVTWEADGSNNWEIV